nr:retrovirus-related Pol polyprotein from transposon TNT 1-94 [Tanacetum cinerariifolium]
MFVPSDSKVSKLKTTEDLQEDALLHYDAEIELMNLILLSILNDIYNSVDACTSAKDMWKRVKREALVSVYKQFAQLMNDLEINDTHFPIVTINTKTLRNLSLGNTSTVQCYNCSGKGHYARNYPKPRVWDSKYFMKQILLAKQDEAGVILTDEQNDFIFVDASRMEEIEDLGANICLMARIQPTNHSSDVGPSYDSAFQNGVVERRNRSLVEAARTMLIFSRLPEFLWAEAVAIACFTQNRSIIHTQYNKTPYELLHGQKPNVEFFYVFGSLCYPTNDRDNLGKMKPKADVGMFIEPMNTPSKEDLDNLFGPMIEEYFGKKSSDTPINSAAQLTQLHEDLPSTSSINIKEHEAPPIETTSDETTSPISLTKADELHQEDSGNFDGDSQFVSYNPISYEAIKSSSTALEPSNVQNFHQVQPSTHSWTKDHPLDQVIGDLFKPVMTRQSDNMINFLYNI